MINRRDALKLSGASALAAFSSAKPMSVSGATSGKRITEAGYPYDRVRAIRDGEAGMGTLEVTFQPSNISVLNDQVLGGGGAFDIAEVGLIPYMTKYIDGGFRDYVLLPIFISRSFRHRNIYVHVDSGIEKPEDLRGRKVGTPGYGASSNTWIRGMLQDQYSVAPDDMEWIETQASSDKKGGLNTSSGGGSRYHLPTDFPLIQGPPGVDESQLLLSGACDALITAITPRAVAEGDPKVRTLFRDFRAAEQAYYRDTGLFPIMHAVAIRADLAAENPSLPSAVFSMYSEAKHRAYQDLASTTVLLTSLPWAADEYEDTRSLMGDDYWRYGVEANKKELELLVRYAHEQGLVSKRINYLDMFHPLTVELTG